MPSDVNDLFNRAMIGIDDDNLAPPDNPTGWSAISALHRIGSREVLEAALLCGAASDPLRRRIGAAVLGQLGHSKPGFVPVFVEERFDGLMKLLEDEQNGAGDTQVLDDVCMALSHLHDPRAIPALLGLRRHPEWRVRYSVTMGLSGHDVPEAIDGLIALSEDDDDLVRDWATFGLGQQIKTDTPVIRAALHARLDDPCIEARNEAITGLVTRGDRSVLPVVIRELRQHAAAELFNAAIELATPELCDALALAGAVGLCWESEQGTRDLTDLWADAWMACGCR